MVTAHTPAPGGGALVLAVLPGGVSLQELGMPTGRGDKWAPWTGGAGGAEGGRGCGVTPASALQMYGSQEDGSIDEDALSSILKTALGVAELAVTDLFQAIDQEEKGRITFGERGQGQREGERHWTPRRAHPRRGGDTREDPAHCARQAALCREQHGESQEKFLSEAWPGWVAAPNLISAGL